MREKVVLIADPGIDTALAMALAIQDPSLDVLGIVATAGNVSAEQATHNVYTLIGHIDPPKWPRVGASLPIVYDLDGEQLHGPGGLGGLSLPSAIPAQLTPGDKLLIELARGYPDELTVLCLGPATMLAHAYERDPDLHSLIRRTILVGGTWKETGNSTPTAEFHFHCDPVASRTVLHAFAPATVVPLDVTRKLIFSPADLMEFTTNQSRTGRLLRGMAPYAIRTSSHVYGIEGFHLKDVVGVLAVATPQVLTRQEVYLDIEVRGELTRGMLVVDDRPTLAPPPNGWLATDLDVNAARSYLERLLKAAA